MGAQLSVLVIIITVGVGALPNYVVYFCDPFLHTGLLIQPQCDGMCLVLFSLLCCAWLMSLGVLLLSERSWKRVNLREKERAEIAVRI